MLDIEIYVILLSQMMHFSMRHIQTM